MKKIAHRDVPTRLGVPTWFGSMIAKNLGKVELHLDEFLDLVLALKPVLIFDLVSVLVVDLLLIMYLV